MKVHILATCRDPEIAGGTTLVFDTLRVGFPDNEVIVYVNKGCKTNCPKITALCQREKCELRNVDGIHHVWIESLVITENEPFIILDTDIIFWNKFELGNVYRPIAGRYTPRFYCKFTKAFTMHRLHTSLMYIDPEEVRREMRAVKAWFNQTRFNPIINPFYPIQIPDKDKSLFFDTCALLYHAIGGQEFTEEQLESYDHLNAGTWVKELAKAYPELNMVQAHREIYKNPKLAKGIRKLQDQFYALHSSP